MLRDIATFPDDDRFDALVRRVWAADLGHAAYLIKSDGRSRGGVLRFTLVVKHRHAPALKLRDAYHDFYNPLVDSRAYIRAHSLSDAIEIANKRLEKMLAKKGAKTQ